MIQSKFYDKHTTAVCVWQAPLTQLCYKSITDDLRFNQSFETETPLCVWQAPLTRVFLRWVTRIMRTMEGYCVCVWQAPLIGLCYKSISDVFKIQSKF